MNLTPVYKTEITGGVLADRVSKNIDNLLMKIDAAGFAAIFGELHDSGYAEPEFAGQYVDICVQEHRRSGGDELVRRAGVVVGGMIDGQREDGYLGTYVAGKEFDETFSVWNQQFAIKGLLSYHELTGDAAALDAAVRCADYIAGHYLADGAPDILRTTNQCMENTCILEQYVRLFEITGKPLYLEFAEFIIRRWEETTMKFITAPLEWRNPLYSMGVLKAAECLICYHGIIALSKATGNERYLAAAKRYWELINTRQINVIGCGALTELWAYQGNKPANTPIDVQPNETCVAYVWMRMSALLFELTGDSKYIDAIEKTLFNHIIGAQAFDGSDFSYYQGLVGKKVHAKHPGQYSCCRYRGMAFLSYVPNYFVTSGDDAVFINLFAESTSELSVHGISLTVRQETDFPRSGKLRIAVESGGRIPRAIKIRRPAWCGRMTSGGAELTADDDGYVTLSGSLNTGTHLFDLDLEMTVGVLTANVDHLPSACVMYGPVTLAVDSRYGTPIHGTEIAVEKVNGEARIDLRPIAAEGPAPVLRFECDGRIDGGKADVTLVDYGSAGSIDKENDWFKVWIPAVEG